MFSYAINTAIPLLEGPCSEREKVLVSDEVAPAVALAHLLAVRERGWGVSRVMMREEQR